MWCYVMLSPAQSGIQCNAATCTYSNAATYTYSNAATYTCSNVYSRYLNESYRPSKTIA